MNNVSVNAMIEAVERVKNSYTAKINSEMEEAINTYKVLQQTGALSSQRLDEITNSIRSQISKLLGEFNELSSTIRNQLNENAELIESQQASLGSQLQS